MFRTYAIAFVRYVPQDGFGFRALRVSGSDGRMFRRVPVPCVCQVRTGTKAEAIHPNSVMFRRVPVPCVCQVRTGTKAEAIHPNSVMFRRVPVPCVCQVRTGTKAEAIHPNSVLMRKSYSYQLKRFGLTRDFFTDD